MACSGAALLLMGTHKGREEKFHYQAPFLAADVLLAISSIVVGILGLTLASFPIALTSSASWALIGAGGGVLTPLLMLVATLAKNNSPLKGKYCCLND